MLFSARAAVMVFIIIAALLMAGVILPLPSGEAQTVAANNEWQQYEALQQGFRLSYPAHWELVPPTGDDNLVMLQSFEPQTAGVGRVPQSEVKIDILTITVEPGVTGDMLANQSITYPASVLKREVVSVSGSKATRQLLQAPDGDPILAYYLTANGRGFIISAYGDLERAAEVIETLEVD